MKNLALISLRNDYLNDRDERRDSIDTAIYKLLTEINLIPIPIPNSHLYIENIDKIFNSEDIKCVLLTGGNDLSALSEKGAKNIHPIRDEVEISLIKFCIKNNIPIIGICRGFQLIANYLGGNIEPIDGHVKTIHEIKLSENSKNINVNSFHSFGLKNKNLPSNIETLGLHIRDNTIECFKTFKPFRSLNFMWHPERSNGARLDSIELIKGFLESSST